MSGSYVENTNELVLIRNVSNHLVGIPRPLTSTKDAVVLAPRGITQVTWAEYVQLKNMPNVSRDIELHESVEIVNGRVKIRNSTSTFSTDSFSEILSLNLERIKEIAYSEMSPGDRLAFKTFLETRIALEIDPEKSSALIEFIDTMDEKLSSPKETKKLPGRPKKQVEPDNQ